MIELESFQYIWLFFIMLFCHIFDDYFLQGCLATLKQKDYWEDYTKDKPEKRALYKNDYLAALICHGFSWSFMIMLPLNIVSSFKSPYCIVMLFINFAIHTIVDNSKANVKSINLCEDQIIHLIQVFFTWAMFINIHIGG